LLALGITDKTFDAQSFKLHAQPMQFSAGQLIGSPIVGIIDVVHKLNERSHNIRNFIVYTRKLKRFLNDMLLPKQLNPAG